MFEENANQHRSESVYTLTNTNRIWRITASDIKEIVNECIVEAALEQGIITSHKERSELIIRMCHFVRKDGNTTIRFVPWRGTVEQNTKTKLAQLANSRRLEEKCQQQQQ